MDDKQTIYDRYLLSDMHEADLIVGLDRLQAKSIKKNGVIYTPLHIVNTMLDISKPHPDMTIIEPACGHGIFLFQLLSYMNQHYNLSGMDLYQWFVTKVTAIDISDTTIQELNDILILYFYKHHGIQVSTFDNIITADSLYYTNNHYDLALGNPPYVRTKNLDTQYLTELRTNFKSCKTGNVDIYYAFIEKYLNHATMMCFITPNSFLNNVSAKTLRTLLQDKLSLLIDFKQKLIFQDARTYTCIFKTTTNNNNTLLYANDIDQPLIEKNISEICKDNIKVCNIDTVLSGIATLCDSVFKVKKINDKYFATYNATTYEIEKDIIVPYLKLSKLKPEKLEYDYMIYPYNSDKSIIPEDIFKQQYPYTYHYLTITLPTLSNRDKGKTSKYDSWYAYGRKQGLHSYTNDVIIIPIMVSNDCKPFRFNLDNLLSNFKTIVFTSGFIVPYKPEYNSILSDDFVDYAKTIGKPWPGSYYSLTTTQIKAFPI